MNSSLIILSLLIISLYANYILLRRLLRLNHLKRSQSVKYGKMSEQFFPFLNNYPYDSSKFRFLGSPIDGIQFDDDKIVLVEFKTGDSRLTKREKRIKELINSNKVKFEVFRIN